MWYKTGTISVTNASDQLVGVGTDFLIGANAGEAVQVNGGEIYEIQSIESATALTLSTNYVGSTETGKPYAIVPTQALAGRLASEVSSLVAIWSDDDKQGPVGNGVDSGTYDAETGVVTITLTDGTSIVTDDLRGEDSAAGLTLNQFIGDGSTLTYSLSSASIRSNTLIYVNGVYQSKSNYAVSSSTPAVVTFTTAPPLSSNIEIVVAAIAVTSISTVEDGSVVTSSITDLAVTTAKIADGAITADKLESVVALTGAGTTTITGTYPNFTVTGTGGGGSTYTAGAGLQLVGTEFRNTVPDQTVALTGAGATTITGTYPNFTITSTDTNTDTDTDTTYSAGTGMTLAGTVFNCEINTPTDVGLGNLSSSGNYVTGNFTSSGNITAYSDSSLKSNVHTLEDALSTVCSLRGVSFTRDDLHDQRQIGFIAQELEVVVPEVVCQLDNGIKTVAYGNVVALLVEAVKELKAEIERLS
tara:strand:- start:857 stop:2272 length:1416 start_codon:yes stop_codon:yes gene_type:complete